MHPRSPHLYIQPSADLSRAERDLVHRLASFDRDVDSKDVSALISLLFHEALNRVYSSSIQEWISDGLSVSEPQDMGGGRVRMTGACYWLSGGETCERYQFDIDTSRDPYRYSFKLKGGRKNEQVAYIAKTDDGWFINAKQQDIAPESGR
ncbi:MAG: hypothetical protein AAGL69_07225 [Pseudomonadota bacterium]